MTSAREHGMFTVETTTMTTQIAPSPELLVHSARVVVSTGLGYSMEVVPMRPRLHVKRGQTYGHFTVIAEAPRRREKSGCAVRYVTCRCDCGTVREVRLHRLLNGKSKSCGCCRTEGVTTHGQFGTPAYKCWDSIIQRCTNPNSTAYRYYGGRGITVCTRWRSFENFLADMGAPKPGDTIDRIDNDGNYERENCRWITQPEQMRNMRRNHRITHDGKAMCLSEWSEVTGINAATIRYRLQHGCTVADALTRPLQSGRKLCVSST